MDFGSALQINWNSSKMSQNEAWYFSYGSNLSKQQMLSRTGSIPESVQAKLIDYQLAFRRVLNSSEVYATIVPVAGSIVIGAAYRCSQHAMNALDRCEGVAENCYRRENVRVETITGDELDCIVYIGESFSEGDDRPSDSYLNWILTGAEEHNLPSEYIAVLFRQSRVDQ